MSAGRCSRWAARPSLAVWLIACGALAALSLLGMHSLNYDAFSWLIRAREIVHGTLDTRHGAAWKPLPVILDLPLVLAGRSAAPTLWLLVARTGTLMALVMLVRVGARIAGGLAGLSAAVLFVLVARAPSGVGVIPAFVLGVSDLLTVAFVLLAVESHLTGRRRAVLWWMTAGALVRPEAGLFLAAYAALLWFRHPEERTPAVGAVVLLALLWIVPDYLGSGALLRGSQLARGQIPPAVRRPDPGVAVLEYPHTLLILPTKLGVLLAGLVALKTRDRLLGVLLGLAVAWTATVAIMAQAGYPGLPRFLATPLALAALLAGIGASRAAAMAGPTLARRTLLAAWAALIVLLAPAPVRALSRQLEGASAQARSNHRLTVALQRAATTHSLRACRTLAAGRFAVPIAGWYLPGLRVTVFERRADLTDLIVLQVRPDRPSVPHLTRRRARRYRVIATEEPWTVLYRCPRGRDEARTSGGRRHLGLRPPSASRPRAVATA